MRREAFRVSTFEGLYSSSCEEEVLAGDMFDVAVGTNRLDPVFSFAGRGDEGFCSGFVVSVL